MLLPLHQLHTYICIAGSILSLRRLQQTADYDVVTRLLTVVWIADRGRVTGLLTVVWWLDC